MQVNLKIADFTRFEGISMRIIVDGSCNYCVCASSISMEKVAVLASEARLDVSSVSSKCAISCKHYSHIICFTLFFFVQKSV